jgi:aryl-alcohol dehydrogenase-like predicted oxidoreductase
MQQRNFGKTNIKISAIGIGVMQFSQAVGVFKYMFPSIPRQTCKEIIEIALKNNINWFDTAEYYGKGASEKSLDLALKDTMPLSKNALVATKWWPVMRFASSIPKTIGKRISNLGGRTIDLHQVHHPVSFSSIETQMQEMAKLVEAGKIRSVGVSNFSAEQMRKAHTELAKYNIPLAANQVEYSLLKRNIEHNGVLDTAKELGITIIAWGPLSSGILTGKFHKNPEILENAPRGKKMIIGRQLEKTKPVTDLLENIADQYDVSATQVALNWLVTNQGDTVVAIPGASKVSHAQEAGTALDFTLSKDELAKINKISTL